MGLFDQVQQELFAFIGTKPIKKQKTPQSFESLGFSYEIKRVAHQKRVSFSVNHAGTLTIRANKSISESGIFKLLVPHLDWINAQIKERENLRINFPQKMWKTGESFFYGGQDTSLIMTASETKKPFIRFMSISFEYFFPRTWLDLDIKTLEFNLHEGLLKFFKEKATFDLNAKVNFWSEKMSLYPSSVSYRNQRTRWGSCSSKGRVNFNWKLACFDEGIQDYVVIHELAHLKHQDHSKRFWSLVEVYCPNYKNESKKLDKEAFKVDCFLPKSELYDTNPRVPESFIR